MDVEPVEYPWERRKGESEPAWQAFQMYRDMPLSEASMRQVARTLGKSEALIYRWSARHEWVERRSAWDAEQDHRRVEAMTSETVEMAKRHATNAAAYMRTLLLPAEEIIRRIRENRLGLSELTVKELMSLNSQAARVFPTIMAAERIARGQSQGSQHLLRPTQGQAGAVVRTEDQMAEVFAALEQAGLTPGGGGLPFAQGDDDEAGE